MRSIDAESANDAETERALVARAKSGDHQAFAQLLRCYDRRIMNVLLRFCANRCDREDLYQEVFTACYRALPRFNESCAFYTWLYRIALNQCISFLRKQKPWVPEQELPVAGHDWEREARLAAIHQAKNRLAGPQQLSFHLFYIEQWSLEEIAAVLDCNTGSVKSHLHRAREKVRSDVEVQKWKIEI